MIQLQNGDCIDVTTLYDEEEPNETTQYPPDPIWDNWRDAYREGDRE